MSVKFFCSNRDRSEKVRESDKINGIDYLEIISDNQKILRLWFLHDLKQGAPASPPDFGNVTKENVIIEGGVRIKGIKIVDVLVNDTQPYPYRLIWLNEEKRELWKRQKKINQKKSDVLLLM